MAELPYTREVHPMYDAMGGVPAIEEVRFSVIHNRGCFGGCNFCALAFHQGRMVTSRSHESVIREVDGDDQAPALEGLRLRRRRSERQLPPPLLRPAAQKRHVREPQLPRADALQEHRRRPLGLSRAAAQAPEHSGREKGVCTQRDTLRLHALRQEAATSLRSWCNTTSPASSRWRRSTA